MHILLEYMKEALNFKALFTRADIQPDTDIQKYRPVLF